MVNVLAYNINRVEELTYDHSRIYDHFRCTPNYRFTLYAFALHTYLLCDSNVKLVVLESKRMPTETAKNETYSKNQKLVFRYRSHHQANQWTASTRSIEKKKTASRSAFVRTSSGSINNNNNKRITWVRRFDSHWICCIRSFCFAYGFIAAVVADKMVLFRFLLTKNNNNNSEKRKIPLSSLYLCRR